MKGLAARFSALKQKVGGNREKMEFESTFGASPEELGHVTRPSAACVRTLSQIQFALELSEAEGGRWDAAIDQALRVLEDEMAREDALTRSACARAEQALMPAAEAAKAYELIYVAHAHIDMNWMWGWQETVAATLATFRTILHLMDEYPGFTFMQSQGSVYRIVEKYDPSMMEEIKRRIREGRWEVTASAWVETDKNMPDTESLLHHITVTRDYLRDVWGVDPDSVQVDFSPDTFGHSRFVPEINCFENVRYYYHCRGLEELETLYRYRAPSGSEVLAYKEPYWYNSGVNPDNGTGLIGLSRRCGGLKTGLIVYGVGDHGGGPTRRDVERVLEMAQWPVFPQVRFGTLHEYFRKAESVRDSLTVIEHELNPLFTGCYTTQSRIKLGNRRSEVAMNDAEKICALAGCVTDAEYPAGRFREAWQNVLFTHFHDILTGSCVQESREHAMGLYADALACAQTAQGNALRAVAESVDTLFGGPAEDVSDAQSEGAGVGYGLESYGGVPNCERGAGRTRRYVVFNTASTPRDEAALITMWDYTGDLRRLEVVNDRGTALPFELLDPQPQRYWDHHFVRLLARVKVPAVGYTTLAVRERALEHYPTYYLDDVRVEKPHGRIVLENARIRCAFDADGTLTSMIDRQTGREQLSGRAGLRLALAEQRTNNAWNIGRILKNVPVDDTIDLQLHRGPLAQRIEITQKVLHSTVKTVVSLDADAAALKLAFEVDWNEAAGHGDRVPLLLWQLPVAGGAEELLCDVPAGCIRRSASANDVAALSFSAALGDGIAPALFADCKYGYRLDEGALSCTLINTAGSPDPYPERGIHKIQLWLAPSDGNAVSLKRMGEALMRPLIAMPAGAKPGKLPREASLLTMQSAGCVLSGVERGGDGALKVRVFEMQGRGDRVTLELPFSPERAACGGTPAAIDGRRVSFDVRPYSLAEVVIRG